MKQEEEPETFYYENKRIGMTDYRFKDLPNWAKEAMIKQYREEVEQKNRK
ncbi:MAG: hypothetical protein VW298_02805 [Candidatus Woesearchaeota archaeon]